VPNKYLKLTKHNIHPIKTYYPSHALPSADKFNRISLFYKRRLPLKSDFYYKLLNIKGIKESFPRTKRITNYLKCIEILPITGSKSLAENIKQHSLLQIFQIKAGLYLLQ